MVKADMTTSDSAPLSTPPPVIFSDDTPRPSSPPSSPPGFPWDYADNTTSKPKTPPQPPQRTAFSILGKRKALSPICRNAQPRSAKRKATTTAAEKDGAGNLTQMQISLGQRVQKRCPGCGMQYVASSAEDRKLHDRYHKQSTEGYDVGGQFVRSGTVFDGLKEGDKICVVVEGGDKAARRAKATAVLEVVQRELGAVELELADGKGEYRHYLYLRGTRCIGYLLTERIDEAREVLPAEKDTSTQIDTPRSAGPPETKRTSTSALLARRKKTTQAPAATDAPLQLSQTPTSASLGISRIWTSSAHRRQNVASALLDAACNTAKEAVAFSHPTASGARLARGWFGRSSGWKVYVD